MVGQLGQGGGGGGGGVFGGYVSGGGGGGGRRRCARGRGSWATRWRRER